MEVQALPLNGLHGCQHVADELARGRSGWVNPDCHHGLLQRVALLCLGRGGALCAPFLVAIHGIDAGLISLDHRLGNLEVELLDDVLSCARVANDEDAVVQAAHDLRLIPEVVPRPCHQRSEQGGTGEEHGRQFVGVHIQKQLLHAGKFLRQLLQLLCPFVQRQLGVDVVPLRAECGGFRVQRLVF